MTHAVTPTELSRSQTRPATILTEADAARYIGMSVHYLRRARVQGRGPAYVRMGRAIRYRITDLDRFVDERVYRPAA